MYQQAWDAARDDYEACIAAHYLARFQNTPQDRLRWDLTALERATSVGDDRVRDFYPSLYVNLGHDYEVLGDIARSNHYYHLAAGLGLVHRAGESQTAPPTPKKQP